MKAGSVLGTALEPLELVVERMLHKLLDNTSHPLQDLLVRQQSVFSFNKDRCNKEIYNGSPLCRERRLIL